MINLSSLFQFDTLFLSFSRCLYVLPLPTCVSEFTTGQDFETLLTKHYTLLLTIMDKGLGLGFGENIVKMADAMCTGDWTEVCSFFC